MILHPFKRLRLFICGHSVFALKEPLVHVDFHEPGYVYLRGILKRADGELPILCFRQIDHDLIDKV